MAFENWLKIAIFCYMTVCMILILMPKKVDWGHSTWQEGCRLAKLAQVRRLIITHHDPSFSDEDLRLLKNGL